MTSLKISHLNVHYGPVPALLDISILVPAGKVIAVVGANGAGKSTLLRAISGVARDAEGSIMLGEQVLLRRGLGLGALATRHLRSDEIVRAGVVHVPEGRQVFQNLTVHENLRLGAFTRRDTAAVAGDLERIYQTFPQLAQKTRELATRLSGGQQQMLAIARGLMARPRLLMLDEPSVGLAPMLVKQVFEIIKAINKDSGCSVLLVEQNATAALEIAEYGYVLEAPGHIAFEGTVAQIQQEDAVRKAYLG